VLPSLSINVHESRRFDPAVDILANRTPPRVRMERAVVDAAAWTSRGRAACGLALAAIQQRLTTADRLRSALRRAGRVRHVALLRAVLGDFEGGADALSEIDFGEFCRRHRLGTPTRQTVRLDANGRRRYIDASLVRADGSVVSIEIDGAVHLLAETYWSDCARGNETVIAGDSLLRFPTMALYLAEAEVADQLRRALAGPIDGQLRPVRRYARQNMRLRRLLLMVWSPVLARWHDRFRPTVTIEAWLWTRRSRPASSATSTAWSPRSYSSTTRARS
jgi:hypothetical protein